MCEDVDPDCSGSSVRRGCFTPSYSVKMRDSVNKIIRTAISLYVLRSEGVSYLGQVAPFPTASTARSAVSVAAPSGARLVALACAAAAASAKGTIKNAFHLM